MALVVTLAVFFFIYLICMGVYAVGTNVRERIHLQNACDAAAYSAAVVQADTFSRIATINRAMSWTYVQLTRRQMDYIVYKWLEKTEAKYKESFDSAKAAGSAGLHEHLYWSIGAEASNTPMYNDLKTEVFGSDSVRLNENVEHEPTFTDIWDAKDDFIASNLDGLSFYADELAKNSEESSDVSTDDETEGVTGKTGIDRLTAQMDADRKAIGAMNASEKNLIGSLKDRMESAAVEILKANALVTDDSPEYIYFVDASEATTYFENAQSSDEERFLKWAGYEGGASATFETGIDVWFKLKDSSDGLYRYYEDATSSLEATWEWKSWTWVCTPPPVSSCEMSVLPVTKTEECRASEAEDGYFKGDSDDEDQMAKPQLLKADYFGGKGTISVGLARKSANPFAMIFDVGGIFTAFDSFGSWTVALASAKAGYAHNIPDDDGRDYWISYKRHWGDKSEPLNMSQSNWDAVLIPVRMAKSKADGRDWPEEGSGNKKPQWHAEGISDHIETWMGGAWKDLLTGNDSDENPMKAMAGEGVAQSEGDASDLGDGETSVRVQWLVEHPGANVNWGQLTERMFH